MWFESYTDAGNFSVILLRIQLCSATGISLLFSHWNNSLRELQKIYSNVVIVLHQVVRMYSVQEYLRCHLRPLGTKMSVDLETT